MINNRKLSLDNVDNLIAPAYTNEPCRICGRMIEEKDLPTLRWAGYSDVFVGVRSMHLRCAQGMADMLKSATRYDIELMIGLTPMPEQQNG